MAETKIVKLGTGIARTPINIRLKIKVTLSAKCKNLLKAMEPKMTETSINKLATAIVHHESSLTIKRSRWSRGHKVENIEGK